MQLQLALSVADRLYETLVVRGGPVDALEAVSLLTASADCPPALCREILGTLVARDRRFCWTEGDAVSRSQLPGLSLQRWTSPDPLLASVPFVALDLETTGPRPGTGKITEIGMIRYEGFREVARFSSLVNPRRPIPPIISAITGITQEMVAQAPLIDELISTILSLLEGAVVVAHNAAFDVGFLNYELRRLKGCELGDGAIDTLPLSRALLPGLTNYKLRTVAAALEAPVNACHRALADAEAAGHVFLTLIDRLQDQGATRLSEAHAYSVFTANATVDKLALTRDLPDTPGTYTFVAGEDRVLFVGSAEKLKDEVRAHFTPAPSRARKVRRAVRLVERIDWESTGTSLEAAVQEQRLISEHRPPYNQSAGRPEGYVYLKAQGARHGLHLCVSTRPPRHLAAGVEHGRKPASPLTLGPFRGRLRLVSALELLRQCYPLSRCPRQTDRLPCARGEAGDCLGPCSGDQGVRNEHDRLVHSLLAWIMGAKYETTLDPVREAETLAHRLAREGNSAAAEHVEQAMVDLLTIKRSYAALSEAHALHFAFLAPLAPNGDGRPLRLNLVWNGLLREPVSLRATSLEADIAAALDSARWGGSAPTAALGPVAVRQEEVDHILAVRRWFKDDERPQVVHFSAAPITQESLDAWRERLTATARRLLQEADPPLR